MKKNRRKLPKNNLSKLTMMFGLIGTLCLVISHFIPCLTVGGISKFFVNDEYYVIVFAILSMITIFIGDVLVPAITSCLSLYYFIDYTNRITEVYKQYATTTTILYGVGYYLLLVGFAFITAYVVFGLREKIKQEVEFRKTHPNIKSKTEENQQIPTPVIMGEGNANLTLINGIEEQKKEEVQTSIWNQNSIVEETNEENVPKVESSLSSAAFTTEYKTMPTTEAAKRHAENPVEYHFPEMPVKEKPLFEPTTEHAILRGEAINPKEQIENSDLSVENKSSMIQEQSQGDVSETTQGTFNPFTFELSDDVHKSQQE